MGLGVVGLEPERAAVFGLGLVRLPWAARAMPRLLWAWAWSGWSRMAVRNSASASASLPWSVRTLPRLLWASACRAGAGWRCGIGDGLGPLPLGRQGVAEVVVGPGVVGLEPDGGAEFGLGLGRLALGRQGEAEVVVGLGVVGLEPDGGAGRGDGAVQDRRRVVGPAVLLQVSAKQARCRAFSGRRFVRSRKIASASSPRPIRSSRWARSCAVSGRRARAAV